MISFKLRDAQLDAHPNCVLKAQIAPAHVTRTVQTEFCIGENVIPLNAGLYNVKFNFHNVAIYWISPYSVLAFRVLPFIAYSSELLPLNRPTIKLKMPLMSAKIIFMIKPITHAITSKIVLKR